MLIQEVGVAGTMESSDIHVTIEPNPCEGIEIHLKSPVEKQFGEEIRGVIQSTLRNMSIENAVVRAIDKGALNCTIEARVVTAAMRSTGQNIQMWEVMGHE